MEFKTLDRNEILEYIDAKLKKLSFNKKGKLYVYYKGNLVITFYPVYAGAKATIDFLIGDYDIWYQFTSIAGLKEGNISFIDLLNTQETAKISRLLPYRRLLHLNIPHQILDKYKHGELFGPDISMNEYLSVLDVCLFPFLEKLTTWEVHKKVRNDFSLMIPQGKYKEVNIALYDKNFLQMQEIYRIIKECYGQYAITDEQVVKELGKLASYVELLENKQWDTIDEILYNDSRKMKALLKKYNIKEAP